MAAGQRKPMEEEGRGKEEIKERWRRLDGKDSERGKLWENRREEEEPRSLGPT